MKAVVISYCQAGRLKILISIQYDTMFQQGAFQDLSDSLGVEL